MKYETNNGYRCGCCRNGINDYEWIDEKDLPDFEQVLEEAYGIDFEGVICKRYEKDGEILYGYEADFDKHRREVNLVIGNKSYRIIAEGTDKHYFTREEIIIFWYEHLATQYIQKPKDLLGRSLIYNGDKYQVIRHSEPYSFFELESDKCQIVLPESTVMNLKSE